jgi:type IV secretion system protein TrbE
MAGPGLAGVAMTGLGLAGLAGLEAAPGALGTLAAGWLGGALSWALLGRWREHRSEPAGLADWLLWAYLVDEGVVLGKDGSLLCGWSYRGPDSSAATAEELGALSAHVSQALLPFGNGWMVHWNAVRHAAPGYAPPGAFPDPVTALIDEERRRSYEATAAHFETDTFVTLSYLPPPDLYSRLARCFVQGEESGLRSWEGVLAAFLRSAGELERRLGAALRMERLGSDGLLTLLHSCLTGLDHPVKAPVAGSELDSYLCDQEAVGGWRPRIGRMAIRVVAVQGFPAASYLGMLDKLNSLPFAVRLSHRVIPLAAPTAARLIRRQQVQWFMKRQGAIDLVRGAVGRPRQGAATPEGEAEARLFLDQDAQRMAADAGEAAGENASGQVRFCLYTPAVVVMQPGEEAAGEVADEVVKVLADRGFTARIEDVNAVEAWLGSLPGHGYPNLRRPLLHSRNVADLVPLSSIWPGLKSNPSAYFPEGSPPLLWAATSGATPLRVSLHASDVGHSLVAGPTGAGKSTLVNLAVAQWFRYPGAQAFVFDLGYSGYVLAQAAGGSHFAIRAGSGEGSTAFQPLAEVDDPAELAAAAEWIELLVGLQGGAAVGPAARSEIVAALRQLAGEAREHRTLSNFRVQLQSLELKDALEPYARSGSLGRLFDADRDDLDAGRAGRAGGADRAGGAGRADRGGPADRAGPAGRAGRAGRYQVFEMSHLWEMGSQTVAPALRYLFHRVERRLDGRPALIVIEEAWRTLLDPAFGMQLKQWLLTLRKKNAAVMVVTQTLADLQRSPYRAAVVESCPTRILLPNPMAASAGTAELYRDLGLNEAELELLAGGRPKRDYYLKSPHGSRAFELGLGPVALAFLAAAEGMTPQETQQRVDELRRERGADWPAAWLEERGLGEWVPEYRRFERGAGDARARA